jgi:hypothetical protein
MYASSGRCIIKIPGLCDEDKSYEIGVKVCKWKIDNS